MPKISTIIPVYNSGRYLKRCVDSILSQGLLDIEIIIIDDGSTDNSPAICDEIAESDNCIKVIHQTNGGVSNARNKGLSVAAGEYIHFADSDDFFGGGFYVKCYELAIKTNADMCCCTTYAEDANGNFNTTSAKDEIMIFDRQSAVLELLKCGKISYSLCDKLFRSSTISAVRLNESLYHNEDFLFCYESIKNSSRIAYTSEPYYYYCHNEGSAVNSPFSKKKMTAVDAQSIVYKDALKAFPEIKKNINSQYFKVLIYLSSQIAASNYSDAQDRNRIRTIIKGNLFNILSSDLAIGYKINALALSCGWHALELRVNKPNFSI